MEIISVNTGKKQSIHWRGKIVLTGIFKSAVDSITLGFEDVKNDDVIDRKHHGGIDKACYLFSANHYTYWKNLYPNLEWNFGMFGENITIKDLNESTIFIGDIYRIGGATVQVTQPRQPCFKLGVRFESQNIIKQFINYDSPGVYVKVLEPETIMKGDNMELVERMHDSISLIDVWHLLYQPNFDNDKMEIALSNPLLAEDCKKSLRKRLKLND